MKIVERLAVDIYFKQKTNKIKCKDVYVSFPSDMSKLFGYGRFIPFQFSYMKGSLKYKKWVKHSLGVCYHHSSSLLLGLNYDDKCVIAKCDYNRNENFYHAWNEFKFNNRWYVYDCQHDCIFEKEKYYSQVEPTILKEFTLKDVVNRFKCFEQKNNNRVTIEVPYELDKNETKLCEIPKITSCLTWSYLYRGSQIKFKNNKIVSVVVPGHELD